MSNKDVKIADFMLTAAERQYLHEGTFATFQQWELAYHTPLTKERAKELDEQYEVLIDDEFCGYDSHGSAFYLVVFRKRGVPDKLYGFQYSCGGETIQYGCGYGDGTMRTRAPVFEVEEKVVTISKFVHPGTDNEVTAIC